VCSTVVFSSLVPIPDNRLIRGMGGPPASGRVPSSAEYTLNVEPSPTLVGRCAPLTGYGTSTSRCHRGETEAQAPTRLREGSRGAWHAWLQHRPHVILSPFTGTQHPLLLWGGEAFARKPFVLADHTRFVVPFFLTSSSM